MSNQVLFIFNSTLSLLFLNSCRLRNLVLTWRLEKPVSQRYVIANGTSIASAFFELLGNFAIFDAPKMSSS